MIYYRGDKFVKGKKFKIDESVYTFIKKSRDNKLVFESVDNKSLLQLTEEEFNEKSRYELVQADSDALDEFYEDNSLTFEGASASKENLDFLYNWLKDLGAIGDSTLPIYTYKGNMMNEKYGLTGYNAYSDDLTFLTVRLDDMQDVSAVIIPRFQIGGRWFNDIVDNNRRHEGTVKESVNTSLSNIDALEEKVNKDNAEINNLIAKVLRSKSLARKNEDKLAKYGIKVDYDQGQGVKLIGPNGETLSSSTKEVYGPTKPGFSNTHAKPDDYYKRKRDSYQQEYENEKDNLEKLKNMDRDDIIRKYNTLSTEDAMKAHEDSIKKTEDRIKNYKQEVIDSEKSYRYSVDGVKREARAGHKGRPYFRDYTMDKDESNEKVDYLNYLTKKHYEKPYKDYSASELVGDRRQHTDEDRFYNTKYYGKNSGPSRKTDRIEKYNDLKSEIGDAERRVKDSSQDARYYGYKSDEDLEKEFQKMRDELEKRIEALKADNDSRKQGNKRNIEELNAKKKELDDYLKSIGVRESVRAKVLSSSNLFEEASREYLNAYYSSKIDELYEEILALAKEAQTDGYTELSKELDDILSMLDRVSI